MEKYRNIETQVVQDLFRRLRSISAPWTAKRVNKAREFGNSLGYSDEEFLIIAENRIKWIESGRGGLLEQIKRALYRMRGSSVPQMKLTVAGQELQRLISLAEENEPEPIIPDNEYEVLYSYYQQLVDLACSRRASQ